MHGATARVVSCDNSNGSQKTSMYVLQVVMLNTAPEDIRNIVRIGVCTSNSALPSPDLRHAKTMNQLD